MLPILKLQLGANISFELYLPCALVSSPFSSLHPLIEPSLLPLLSLSQLIAEKEIFSIEVESLR